MGTRYEPIHAYAAAEGPYVRDSNREAYPFREWPARGRIPLKKPLFKSRKRGTGGHEECLKIMREVIVPRSVCMANTLYRYRIVWTPGDDDGDWINLRASYERMELLKGFRVSDI